MTLKWLKKWSFLIILAIAGIVYCAMDRELLGIPHWEELVQNLALMAEGKPGEGPEPRQEESVSDSAAENPAVQGTVDGEDQAEGTGQAGTGEFQGEGLGQGGTGESQGEGSDRVGAGEPQGEGSDQAGDGEPQGEGPGQGGTGEPQGEGPGQGGTGEPQGEGPGQGGTGEPQGEGPGQGGTGEPQGEGSGQAGTEVMTSQDPAVSEEAQGEGTLPAQTPEPEIVMGRVEEDYFADALFLGDSRTVGLGQYGSLSEIATFYASTGMTIYKLLGSEIVEIPDQKEKITVEEALQHQSFGKIYIMMGINEVGTGTAESFAKAYGEVLARIRELQPDAMIYIEGMLKVTKERSDKGDYINNEEIEARNEALRQLADGEKIFYLDVNQAVCDEDGGLVKDYTSDGVHLKAKYLTLWEEYLKDNAVLIDREPAEPEE